MENLETTKQTAAEVEKKVKLPCQPRLGGKTLFPAPEFWVLGKKRKKKKVRIPRWLF